MRKSIAERYLGRKDYLNRYSGGVDELIKQRWILPEDLDSVTQTWRAGVGLRRKIKPRPPRVRRVAETPLRLQPEAPAFIVISPEQEMHVDLISDVSIRSPVVRRARCNGYASFFAVHMMQ